MTLDKKGQQAVMIESIKEANKALACTAKMPDGSTRNAIHSLTIAIAGIGLVLTDHLIECLEEDEDNA